jgi:glutamate synthase (NADPH/NADH) small chain
VEEGARFEFLTNPTRLIGDQSGAMRAVSCVRMELGEADRSGRKKPREVVGSSFELPADIVIIAYGFDPVPFSAGSEFAQLRTETWGGLSVDENQMTSATGIFSGGDAVRGPSLVVHAVRDGRSAAEGIHRYLQTSSRELPGPFRPVS